MFSTLLAFCEGNPRKTVNSSDKASNMGLLCFFFVGLKELLNKHYFQWFQMASLQCPNSGSIFCLWLGVSSGYAQPITGQVTSVTCPVIGRAQPELTPSKRQKSSHRHSTRRSTVYLGLTVTGPSVDLSLISRRSTVYLGGRQSSA